MSSHPCKSMDERVKRRRGPNAEPSRSAAQSGNHHRGRASFGIDGEGSEAEEQAAAAAGTAATTEEGQTEEALHARSGVADGRRFEPADPAHHASDRAASAARRDER